jgi:hypothetical protein
VAYDILVESQRLIAIGLPDRPVRLSRRQRFAPVAVDVDGDIAATRFVRRGAGCFHDQTHLLTRDGQGWTYRGGGGVDRFEPWSTDEFQHARDLLPAGHVQAGIGPSVWLDSNGWLPLGGTGLQATELLVGRNVVSVLVDDRRRLAVPHHGRLVVVWASRRPPRVSAQDAAQRELMSLAVPGE